MTRIISVLGALAGVATLAGTANAEDLTIWTLNYSSDAQVAALDASEARFEASHPGVNVEIVKRGTDEHKTALRVAAGSDTGPDVYFMWAGLGLGGEYVKAGLSLDLTKYYEKYGWSDRVSTPSLAFVEAYGPGMNGAPYRFTGEAVYYNKSLYEKAGITSEPQTYEELVAAAEKLKEAGIPAFTFGGTVNWHVMRLMDVLLETTCGAETHDALTGMTLDWSTTPCATEAFQELKMWSENYILSPFMGIDNRQSTSLFLSGRAAMMLEGDWQVNVIKEGANLDDFAVYPFPTGTGRLYGFAEYLYISTKSKNPDLAAEFLDMFSSTEFQEEIKGAFGALSVNKSVELGDDVPDLYKTWKEIFATANGTFVNGDQAFPLDVTTEYFRIINEVASGNMEPQAAATAMQVFISNRS
ncbi:ABC transporter substrate-binding protein [Frigidibacter sp. ROC022]|uniref:ABC transporter substrate-binding protein n=1 Tax=Frigidibacter sp. ROC022 TaxID=2971796 RepID=UPI00215AE5A0|nr:extracellular solute-binding protein [Frigidibacter sp. ROC022]MCR8726127.1 extracellular solute-binding protein [Frigidibacter sp. ROC022]